MGLAPSRNGENPGKSVVAKVPVPIFFTAAGEAVKKWDWLRAETAKTLENHWSRRCLSQFFHSLGGSCLLEQPVAAAAVFGGEVAAVFDQFVRVVVAQQVGQFLPLRFVVGHIVAGGRVHQPQTRFDGA
jgi:hypothetical protein